MKVLHVTPSISRGYGGPTYSLAAYARASIAAGTQNTIVATESDSRDEWLAATLPEVEIHTFRNLGRGAFFASPALHTWLRHNGAEFDVVHVHGLLNPVSSLSARACLRNGWPFVIRPFGTMSRYTFEHRRGAMKRAYSAVLDASNLRRASAIHFTTAAERDESTWRGMALDERAFVVPPPWIARQQADSREPRYRRRSVLFLSRLHPVKSLDLLLDSWPIVQESMSDAQLLVAGDGESAYSDAMRARARSLGSSVKMLGQVEESAKQSLFAKADLFVLPSLHENFGIAVLEAVAAGLPVVITPEVQLSTFIIRNSLGVLTEHSPESLAKSIVSALNNDELSDRCREFGAALVAESFSLQSIGESLVDMYRYAITTTPT